MSTEKVYYGTGRRKTSTARVFVKPGKGKFVVNGAPVDDYLKRVQSKALAKRPLSVLENEKFDINVTVTGGGETGQAGAISLGLARALTAFNESWRKPLKDAGLLKRDPREVERKKYGLRGARRRGQYSKR
ncbi:MAG: 30S ribosomal protein S9 [Bdellovibrionaceae bacterium]|jgi:small subunit ribosomal protein S9|nr:30S ribosomal protein S9 [Pseudobdellovibrionaceae bacterium]